jgi:hypothetical protein
MIFRPQSLSAILQKAPLTYHLLTGLLRMSLAGALYFVILGWFVLTDNQVEQRPFPKTGGGHNVWRGYSTGMLTVVILAAVIPCLRSHPQFAVSAMVVSELVTYVALKPLPPCSKSTAKWHWKNRGNIRAKMIIPRELWECKF